MAREQEPSRSTHNQSGAEVEEAPSHEEGGPETRGGIFTLRLTRQCERPLGVDLESTSFGLLVQGISSYGEVQRHNAGSPPATQIRSGDFILEVNGEFSVAEMMAGLIARDELEVKVCRTRRLQITLRSLAMPLGLRLTSTHSKGATVLEVMEVRKGAASHHNTAIARCASGREAEMLETIGPQDCVASVNGVSGNVHKLLEALRKESEVFALELLRVPHSAFVALGREMEHHNVLWFLTKGAASSAALLKSGSMELQHLGSVAEDEMKHVGRMAKFFGSGTSGQAK